MTVTDAARCFPIRVRMHTSRLGLWDNPKPSPRSGGIWAGPGAAACSASSGSVDMSPRDYCVGTYVIYDHDDNLRVLA